MATYTTRARSMPTAATGPSCEGGGPGKILLAISRGCHQKVQGVNDAGSRTEDKAQVTNSCQISDETQGRKEHSGASLKTHALDTL